MSLRRQLGQTAAETARRAVSEFFLPLRQAARGQWRAGGWLGALIVVLACGLAIVDFRREAANLVFRTTIGEFRRLPLEDGTLLQLNTDTQVRIAYSQTQRLIRLARGEAIFTVAPDARRPFIVQADGVETRAVGTEFAVRLRSAQAVDVLVTEGHVVVGSPRVTLSAGHVASIRDGRVSTRSVQNVADKLSWSRGLLVFEGDTLGEAVAEFNRYNRIHLSVADAELAQQRIGGRFSPTAPKGFALALERTLGVHVAEDAATGNLRLSRASP
jgi:transmembrane sensor